MWESDRWIIHLWIYNNGGAHEGVAKKRNSVCRTTDEGSALGMPELGCYSEPPTPSSARQRRPSRTSAPLNISNYERKRCSLKVFMAAISSALCVNLSVTHGEAARGTNVRVGAAQRHPSRSKPLRLSKGFLINDVQVHLLEAHRPHASTSRGHSFICGLWVAYLLFYRSFKEAWCVLIY